jgi:hypothetical protein
MEGEMRGLEWGWEYDIRKEGFKAMYSDRNIILLYIVYYIFFE